VTKKDKHREGVLGDEGSLLVGHRGWAVMRNDCERISGQTTGAAKEQRGGGRR